MKQWLNMFLAWLTISSSIWHHSCFICGCFVIGIDMI
jgi:hypothetical protein